MAPTSTCTNNCSINVPLYRKCRNNFITSKLKIFRCSYFGSWGQFLPQNFPGKNFSRQNLFTDKFFQPTLLLDQQFFAQLFSQK